MLGNARLAGFERDLGLQGYDYNTVLSVFYISKSLSRIWRIYLAEACAVLLGRTDVYTALLQQLSFLPKKN